jgi:hypothetical protein
MMTDYTVTLRYTVRARDMREAHLDAGSLSAVLSEAMGLRGVEVVEVREDGEE